MKTKIKRGIGISFWIGSLVLLLISIYLKITHPFFDYRSLTPVMVSYMISILVGYRVYVSGCVDIEIKEKSTRIMLASLCIYYVIFLICIQYQPEPFYMDRSFISKTNLIPFNQIIKYLFSLFDGTINTPIILQNIFGLILIYIPVGVLLGYIFHDMKKKRLFLIYFSLITLIEIVQLFTNNGVFDIDDIILGMIGCSIGFFILKIKRLKLLVLFALGTQHPHIENSEEN